MRYRHVDAVEIMVKGIEEDEHKPEKRRLSQHRAVESRVHFEKIIIT